MHTQADISSSIEIIDFQPKFTLENGIKAYLPEIVRLYNENS
jgi:ADP-L-glycero-D-manno-heptose 6-epimerase